MDLRNVFLESSDFTFRDNIFYQKDLPRFEKFESAYISLRKKENRFYADDLVKQLPALPSGHVLRGEWRVRNFAAQRLLNYLPRKNETKILELGCGNGWLSNLLATNGIGQVVGMDINETELLQASRVFSRTSNSLFVRANILAAKIPYSRFDYIILAGSLQYFSNPSALIKKLLALLAPEGEIHVLDSPLYQEHQVVAASDRSRKYFSEAGFPNMKTYYHHHSWKDLLPFHPEIIYDPDRLVNKIKRKLSVASPFPWVRIKARK